MTVKKGFKFIDLIRIILSRKYYATLEHVFNASVKTTTKLLQRYLNLLTDDAIMIEMLNLNLTNDPLINIMHTMDFLISP